MYVGLELSSRRIQHHYYQFIISLPVRSDSDGWRWMHGGLVEGTIASSGASSDLSLDRLCLAFSHGIWQEYDCAEKFMFLCQAQGEPSIGLFNDIPDVFSSMEVVLMGWNIALMLHFFLHNAETEEESYVVTLTTITGDEFTEYFQQFDSLQRGKFPT